jgi:hypothetical protein
MTRKYYKNKDCIHTILKLKHGQNLHFFARHGIPLTTFTLSGGRMLFHNLAYHSLVYNNLSGGRVG